MKDPPLTTLKVSVRLRIRCKRTTDVRSNSGVYGTSNKCASSFEDAAAARLFIQTFSDCSDKDEIQRRPRNTEEGRHQTEAALERPAGDSPHHHQSESGLICQSL